MLLRTILLLVLGVTPAGAIVIGYSSPGSGTFGDPDSSTYTVSYNTVADGVNLSGVVEVGSSVGTCTGELLSDDMSILTAAHCLLPNYGTGVLPTNVQVFFNYPGCGDYPYCNGTYDISTSNIFLDPTWISDGENPALGNDLVVLRLSAPAPSFATGYSLFTGDLNSIDLSTPVEVVGVGISGLGQEDGADYPPGNVMRQGEANYVGTCASDPVLGSDCSDSYNLLGLFSANSPLSNQVEIAPGDSGGPTFYNGQLIGVHEFTDCSDGTACSISDPGSYWGDTYVGGTNASWIESVEVSVPEPATVVLLAMGLAGLVFLARRKRHTDLQVV